MVYVIFHRFPAKVFAPSFRPRSPFPRQKSLPHGRKQRAILALVPAQTWPVAVMGVLEGGRKKSSPQTFPNNYTPQPKPSQVLTKCLVKKNMFFSVLKILQNHKSGSSTAPNHFSYQLLVVARWSKKLLETNNISKMSRWHSLAKKWWILQTLVAPSIQSTEHCWFKMGWLKPKRLAWICMIKLSKP